MKPIHIKKNNSLEPFSRDALKKDIVHLCNLEPKLNMNYIVPDNLINRVLEGSYDGMEIKVFENLVAETSAYLCLDHPDYSRLAGRLKVSSMHREVGPIFSESMSRLYHYVHPITKENASLLAKKTFDIIMKNKDRLNQAIVHERDYHFDFFGFKTLERSYLLRCQQKVVERPQHMWMRVSVGIHGEDIDAAIETYNLMSQGYCIHASPTLFNSGTPRPQCSSCFLLTMQGDSIDGIYDTLKQCALISKSAGGIGLSVHKIRSSGSYIRGTNGHSNGLVPMLKVFNDTARYVDQGGGRRKGSFAVYLEPWHSDIFDFLLLKKNTGSEEHRARDLFYAMWIPDLFMKRVEADEEWSLFCPNEAKGLADTYGEEFEQLYEKYEKEGKARDKIKAREVWFAIMDSQIETGTPYMLYKDACNKKSNQKNLGTIRSSNLCTEIIQYTDKDEVAVCNLASIALPKYVKYQDVNGKKEPYFDFDHLAKVVQVVTKNLNNVIDVNYYPVKEAETSNKRHRPIGIGVQGLADAYILMRFPFSSDEARKLNLEIFETIYYAAVSASVELAKQHGAYASFEGSPMSQGLFQFNLWSDTGFDEKKSRYDWQTLREKVKKHGIRNSLLVAPMPTASTSQILGNNECFEPYTTNLLVRRVLSGEFPVINKHLVNDLSDLGLWDREMIQSILKNNGSVQNIPRVPKELKELYKTNWEIKQRVILDQAADRGQFICQSQSLNIFLANPTISQLTSMHFHGWKKGLKTGMYYLRTHPAANAIQFTVDAEKVTVETPKENKLPKQTSSAPPRRAVMWEDDDVDLFDVECLSCGA